MEVKPTVVKTGVLEIFDCKNRLFPQRKKQLHLPQKITVTVYKSFSEYFAVFAPLKKSPNSRTRVNCLNLKACLVDKLSDNLFRVVYGNNLCLIFRVNENISELKNWLRAFSGNDYLAESSGYSCPTDYESDQIRRKYSLAPLFESDETDEA